MALSSDLKVCQVCKESQHKYVCPKCKLLYCSLPCYKKHSADCISQFYDSEFVAAAAAAAPTLHEKRAFCRTLTRIHLEQRQADQQQPQQRLADSSFGLDSSEDEEAGSDDEEASQQNQNPSRAREQQLSEERLRQLQQLATQGRLQLEHLTPEEAASFFSALKRGELIQYFDAWSPWWLSVELPDVEKPPHICCQPTQPDSRLVMTLSQVLYGYAHVMRSFNGSVDDSDVQEAAGHFLAVCKGLESRNPPPSSAVGAVDQTLEWAAQAFGFGCISLLQPPLGCTDSAFSEVCLSDTSRLLSARDFAVKAALAAADLIERFKKLMEQQQRQQPQQHEEEDALQVPSAKQLAKLGAKQQICYPRPSQSVYPPMQV
ncbi:uncharacterized protein LOC34623189 [Cyclospora cayetanensis]|uniref:Uncharacterized protein LOC34623189 n=1 Tax=Cyclospora cayetanensis TaxID=88456 RepID=A0A6P6RY68_9EIME|nr:uncharacterized protein LOC34623189 [Cyclospora cayetanensis]